MRINDALQKFTTQLRADGRSPHTIQQYTRHVHLLATWIDAKGTRDDIAAINHESIAAFLVSDLVQTTADGRIRKATSGNAIRSSLRNFFGYLHKSGDVVTDPTRLVRRARCSAAAPRALSHDEQGRLLRVLDDMESSGTLAERRDAILFKTMLGTGIRIGSALALDVADIDLGSGVVHVGHAKGGSSYRAFLPRDLVEVLGRYIGDRVSGPVFQGGGGNRITTRHAQRRFAAIMEKAAAQGRGVGMIERGMDSVAKARSTRSTTYGTHSLRHTRAQELYGKTGDIMVVKEVLGHRSIASTLVYARVDEARMRAAVGA